MKICCHPVAYIVWSVLCKRVYRTKISNVNELKRRRTDSEWAAPRHAVIEHAVGEYIASASTRLRSCSRQTFRLSICCNSDEFVAIQLII